MSTVVFDIDGTLADVDHRRHFVEGKKKNFKAFYDAMGDDQPKSHIVQLFRMYSAVLGNRIIICTGRPERYREITLRWLMEYNLDPIVLMMRPEGREYEPDWEVKEDMLKEIGHVDVAVDDRNQVVEMWRRHGITCLQVADGNF